MSPESLKTIISANAALSGFLRRVSAASAGNGHPDNILPAILDGLPEIAATIEKAGFVVTPSVLSENLDRESKTQIDLYTENLRKLKSLLSRLLDSAEARRNQLADGTGKLRDTMSWLRTLKATETD
ncbi:MAG: hypothetical protein P8Z30_00600 [Acidobacteriota bacterium]